MALQVSIHGFFLLLQCTKCSDHSPVTQMWCGELNVYQRDTAMYFGGSQGAQRAHLPLCPEQGTSSWGTVLSSSKAAWVDQGGSENSIPCVRDFVSLKHQHKWKKWVACDEFIQRGALTCLCWWSSIWKVKIARLNGISPHHHLPVFCFLSSTWITAQSQYISSHLSWTGRGNNWECLLQLLK